MAKWGRITVVDSSNGSVQVAGKRWRSKKNRIRDRIGWLWPVEHAMREYVRAENKCWAEMFRLHDKSRGKKRDRWLTDGLTNGMRAHTKACNGFMRRI